MKKGHRVSIYTRTKSKAQDLLGQGAVWCNSPTELAKESDIVFSIVGFVKDVEDVLIGKNGVVHNLKPGSIIVDMTTSSPSLAKKIDQVTKAYDCHALDAPVSGGDVGAQNGTLSIMVGGQKDTFNLVYPYFQAMGTNIRFMGGPASGQNTKMVNQILISTNMIGVVEGLLFAYKAGLNLEDVIAAVGPGAAGSWSISNYGPRIISKDYEPGFFVEHFIKDLKIAMEEAKLMNLNLPGLELSLRLYEELEKQGYGKKGTHSLMCALAKLNNMEFDPIKEE